MSSGRAAASSGLRASLLILLAIGAILGVRALATGISPFSQIIAASHRMAVAAANDSQAFGWLGMIAIGFGILVMSDRRRRAKVRQASS